MDVAPPPHATNFNVVDWNKLKNRYTLPFDKALENFSSLATSLPGDCIVVQLSVHEENLIMVRYAPNRDPLAFQMPFQRFAHREGEDDELLPLSLAREELQSIIETSNRLSSASPSIQTARDKNSWWEERKNLDFRMSSLLAKMEKNWIGSFKCLFSGLVLEEDVVDSFAQDLELVLQQTIFRSPSGKSLGKTKGPRLNRQIIECFASFSGTYTDDDLEDFLHFIIDSYQAAGLSIASDEVDADRIGCEIRSKLETAKLACRSRNNQQHVFLILDRELHCFPWESMSILQDRSVSRIPSMSFLQDRLELTPEDTCEITVDIRQTRFLLDPKLDFKHTRGLFQPWLEEMSKYGWKGIIGREPIDLEMKGLLSGSLYLYFGHGSGAQFVESTNVKAIKKLEHCPVAMLWGCSSGRLKEMGDFDLSGNAYNYMLAGCPSLIANLWDVTDKDIDRLAQSVFTHLGIFPQPSISNTVPNSTLALARAREAVKLRYLTGAAAVCYGIPSRFVLPQV
ncbi:hypothetical protein BT69DRAFT_1216644 [Atractiella rhizophila]|nr:hypothetical protein BT69DRAFT_1216644 [Atractiella rhizophila]